ncbi:LPS-assembly protein LptD [Paludibacterium paludis]|uniref:LPS-assembly protein LptD n=2 Tax=Paludibacterium paludis TaxID=1225769 RepID=A0A918P0M8_9NEIS|nr:LPS-assembly protein LptD [Paludibacterium paludis]
MTPIALALATAFTLQTARSEQIEDSVALPAQVPGQVRMDADHVDGQLDTLLKARGNVVTHKDDQTVLSEWLDYYRESSRLKAGDAFRIIKPNEQVDGRLLDYYLDSHTGSAQSPVFRSRQKGATLRGKGDHLEFNGPDQYRIRRSEATTCEPGDESWYLKSSTLDLDYVSNVGVARNATLFFQGVPIGYTPWIDFPLNNGRKTGFLIPTLKTTNNGTELTVPYYFNLAPNYDLTLTPHTNTKHGIGMGAEFRYLQPGYSGTLFTDQLPKDAVTKQHRYVWSGQHIQRLSPQLTFGYDATKVSDDDYFRDFGDRQAIAANVNLLREAWVNYAMSWTGGSANAQARMQRYQTLQDPLSPVTPPYARLPQLTFTAYQTLPQGFSANLTSELTQFSHPTQQEGTRLIAYPSVTWNFARTWGFLRPKLGVNYTNYDLAAYQGAASRNATRTLPVFTVDSGLYFDRDTRLLGSDYTQTLEPRLYYVNIPTKAQSQLPNFDSSENDIGFAQLFTENRFSGGDRINGANQVSAALTSSLINQDTGLETLRVAVGQRFYFRNDDISLSGAETQRKKNGSDILASIGGSLTRSLRLDSSYQYNNDLGKTQRYDMGVIYQPKQGKTLSVRYRYGRDEQVSATRRDYLRQLDIAVQWPLTKNVYALARNNYSLRDRKNLEQLAGVEYNQGCWSVRLVGQRYVTNLVTTRTAYFIQLELKGIGGLGSNPIDTLRLAIPGYSQTRSVEP